MPRFLAKIKKAVKFSETRDLETKTNLNLLVGIETAWNIMRKHSTICSSSFEKYVVK